MPGKLHDPQHLLGGFGTRKNEPPGNCDHQVKNAPHDLENPVRRSLVGFDQQRAHAERHVAGLNGDLLHVRKIVLRIAVQLHTPYINRRIVLVQPDLVKSKG